jgi:hypothetical protein
MGQQQQAWLLNTPRFTESMRMDIDASNERKCEAN